MRTFCGPILKLSFSLKFHKVFKERVFPASQECVCAALILVLNLIGTFSHFFTVSWALFYHFGKNETFEVKCGLVRTILADWSALCMRTKSAIADLVASTGLSLGLQPSCSAASNLLQGLAYQQSFAPFRGWTQPKW